VVYQTTFRWHIFLGNTSAKKYWNRTTIVEIIVGGWVVSFFETHCRTAETALLEMKTNTRRRKRQTQLRAICDTPFLQQMKFKLTMVVILNFVKDAMDLQSSVQIVDTELRFIPCSALINCSTNVQDEGCTLYDLFTQVVQYTRWQQFNRHDANQQRYKEAVDSIYYLCNIIEPG